MADELNHDLYLGLSGLELSRGPLDLGEGVELRPTTARFLSPLVLDNTGQVWTSATRLAPAYWHLGGGRVHEITAELFLPGSAAETDEARLEVGRLIVFVLRMWSTPTVMLRVASSRPLSSLADALASEKGVWVTPAEVYPTVFPLHPVDDSGVEASLEWVRDNWRTAYRLYRESAEFRLGMDALAMGQFVPNTALTMVSLWGALEALFSPSTAELRFRVSALIATYLESPGDERRRRHEEIAKLYDKRSAAAHGRPKHAAKDLLATFELLRSVLVKMVRAGKVPSRDELESLLFGVEP